MLDQKKIGSKFGDQVFGYHNLTFSMASFDSKQN
jgi:hypothetical protein